MCPVSMILVWCYESVGIVVRSGDCGGYVSPESVGV